jgi:hypothetical protein
MARHMFRLLIFCVLAAVGCEFQKERHQNPRQRANLDGSAKLNQTARTLNRQAAQAVKMPLPRILEATGAEVESAYGARFSQDACHLRNRLAPPARISGQLSKYLCVLDKLALGNSSSERTIKTAGGEISFRLSTSADGEGSVVVCEKGELRAQILNLRSAEDVTSGSFRIWGVSLGEDLKGAADGRFELSVRETKYSIRFISGRESANNDGSTARVGSMRFAFNAKEGRPQFFSFAGYDKRLIPMQIAGAGKYDLAQKIAVLFQHGFEQEVGGVSFLDGNGQFIDQSAFADFAKGASLDIRWNEVYRPLADDFVPQAPAAWSCDALLKSQVDAAAIQACEVRAPEVLNCAQEIFQPSTQIKDPPDYPRMTKQFDNLNFDIF